MSIDAPDYNLSRKAWYDRDAASKVADYGGALTPHAETVRITYTCPANKVAMVELLYATIARRTAPTTVDWSSLKWFLTPEGGSEERVFAMTFRENDAGKVIFDHLGTTMSIFEGDRLRAKTTDASTGGEIWFETGYKITEFEV